MADEEKKGEDVEFEENAGSQQDNAGKKELAICETVIGTVTGKYHGERAVYSILYGNVADPMRNGKFMHLKEARYRQMLADFLETEEGRKYRRPTEAEVLASMNETQNRIDKYNRNVDAQRKQAEAIAKAKAAEAEKAAKVREADAERVRASMQGSETNAYAGGTAADDATDIVRQFEQQYAPQDEQAQTPAAADEAPTEKAPEGKPQTAEKTAETKPYNEEADVEDEAKERAEREARIRAQVEAEVAARMKAEDEARAKAKAEAEAKKKREEARLKAEAEAKARAEAQAKAAAAAAEAKKRAEEAARLQAEAEAKAAEAKAAAENIADDGELDDDASQIAAATIGTMGKPADFPPAVPEAKPVMTADDTAKLLRMCKTMQGLQIMIMIFLILGVLIDALIAYVYVFNGYIPF